MARRARPVTSDWGDPGGWPTSEPDDRGAPDHGAQPDESPHRSFSLPRGARRARAHRPARPRTRRGGMRGPARAARSEEHTSELQSRLHLVCRLLLEKKKKNKITDS